MRVKVYELILNEKTHLTELNIIRSFNKDIENKFDSADKIAELMINDFELNNKADEYLYMLTFNNSMKLLGIFEISHGTSDKSLADGRGVYMRALMVGANNIVLVHNHPSRTLNISEDDKKLTNILKKAGELLGIKIKDHIIIAGNCYLSFKEKELV